MKIKLLLTITFFTISTSTFCQKSFSEKILIYHEGKIDFIESYLNLCFLVDSSIDKPSYYREIDRLCIEVGKTINDKKSPQELVKSINNYLFHEEAFRFNLDANKFFFGTDSEKEEVKGKGVSFKELIVMPSVLKRREGICSSLSMLYLTIAYKLDLPIFGVSVPGHLFVRYNDSKIKINIETTNMGNEFSDDYYRETKIKNNKGVFYLKDLNYEETIGLYLSVIGNALLEDKKYEKSIEIYDLAIKINPEFIDSYTSRGIAKYDLQDYNRAIDDFNMAIKINPEQADAFYNRGTAKAILKDNGEAIADYTKAIEIDPKYAAAFYNRGILKNELKDYIEAIDDYTMALNINPEYAAAYYARGTVKISLSIYRGAIADYTMALNINPEFAEAYYSRAIAKLKSGQKESGCLDLSKAKELGLAQSIKLIDEFCH